jgi:phosphate transport system substrate-binding protein
LLRTPRVPRTATLIALTALTTLLLVACGGGDDDPNRISGTVAIDGSSTVFPVTEAVAEEFRAVEPGVRVTVGVSGTGGGFKKFCAGETDISDASRPIKASEQADCTANGIEYLELRVGLDGLAVVTSPDTAFLDGLTLEELELIWRPESEGEIVRWSQVRAGFPDDAIQLFGPGTDSGTFDFFTETVNGEGGASRSDFTASEDDNVLVVGVAGTDGGLGYFGYAYFAENSDQLKVVPIDGVTPSDETVANGSYPLARPLFIYVNTESLAEQAPVREFLRFYLSDEGISLVPEVGYTNIAASELEESRSRLEAAIEG